LGVLGPQFRFRQRLLGVESVALADPLETFLNARRIIASKICRATEALAITPD
jgi:hypothetical protein